MGAVVSNGDRRAAASAWARFLPFRGAHMDRGGDDLSRKSGVLAAILAAGLLAAACGGASAPQAASPPAKTTAAAPATSSGSAASASTFYHGKTVTFIVPAGAAGGFEAWALLIKPYLTKALGASAIDIVNYPGGGTLVGANRLYAAKPDGLTIGDINGAGDVFAAVRHQKGVTFDLAKFSIIGRPDAETHVLVSRAGTIASASQLIGMTKGKPVVALATGVGSPDYAAQVIMYNVFGIPYSVVADYRGTSTELPGLLRGDGVLTGAGYSAVRSLAAAGKVDILLQEATQPAPGLSSVPTVVAVGQQAHLSAAKQKVLNVMGGIMSLGKVFAAPPGVPAARLAVLRKAFATAVQDPGFVAAAKKEHRIVSYASGPALQATIQSALQSGSVVVQYSKAK
jgi:tripartite-type tricarboxylate transporter receptor subunit TctC